MSDFDHYANCKSYEVTVTDDKISLGKKEYTVKVEAAEKGETAGW